MLGSLAKRLLNPVVASALAKEQICISLNSLASLERAKGSTQVLKPGDRTDALLARTTRMLPACSHLELNMIAAGAVPLRWASPQFLDGLVRAAYLIKGPSAGEGSNSTKMNGNAVPRVRLSLLNSLLEAALQNEAYCNVTLSCLVLHGAQPHAADSAEAVETFVRNAARWLCWPAARMQRFCSDLGDRCQTEAQKAKVATLAQTDLSLHASPARAALMRKVVAHDAGTGDTTLDESVIRRRVHHLCLTDESTLPAEKLSDLLRGYVVFALQDPVAHHRLQEMGIRAVQTAGLSTAAAMQLFGPVVYARQTEFTGLRMALEAASPQQPSTEAGAHGLHEGHTASSPGAALVAVSPARAAYAELRTHGRATSDAVLFRLLEVLPTCTPDEVAMVACLCAECGAAGLTERVALAASQCVSQLSVDGAAALLRAAKADSSASLWSSCVPLLMARLDGSGSGGVGESGAGQLSHTAASPQLPVAEASLESLLALADAFAVPLPRTVRLLDSDVLTLTNGAAQVLQRMLYLVAELPLDQAMRVASASTAVASSLAALSVSHQANSDVVPVATQIEEGVCAHLGSVDPSQFTPDELVKMLSFLHESATFANRARVHGLSCALTAVLADGVFAGTFPVLSANSSAGVTGWVLPFARLQHRVEAAQMDEVATHIVSVFFAQKGQQRGGNDGDVSCVALAVAAGLLMEPDRRPSVIPALRTFLSSASSADVQVLLSAPEALPALVDFLFSVPVVPDEVVDSLAGALSDALSQQAKIRIGAVELARVVILDARRGLPVGGSGTAREAAERLREALEPFLRHGLPAGVFTSLCDAAVVPHLPAGFVNLLIQSLPSVSDRMSLSQLARAVLGVSQVSDAGQRLSHQIATEALSAYVVDNAEAFTDGKDIAMLLKGLANLHCVKRDVYSVFSARLSTRAVRATLNRETVALVLSAFGAAKFLDKPLFDRLSAVFTANARGLGAADVFLSTVAHSRVMLLDDAFYEAMGQQAARLAESFPLHAQCELLHAFAAVQTPHDEMADALLPSVVRRLEDSPDANRAADVFTSLWLMDYGAVGAGSGTAGDAGPDAASSEEKSHLLRRLTDVFCARPEELTRDSVLKLCSVAADPAVTLDPAVLGCVAARAVQLEAEEGGAAAAVVSRAVLDVLGSRGYHDPHARRRLSASARTVSKEVVQLSDDEQHEYQQQIAR